MLVVARYLLNNGAHPALVNSDGDTPFDIADDEEAQDLLQSAIDSQGKDHIHCTVIMYNLHQLVFTFQLNNLSTYSINTNCLRKTNLE